MSKVAAGVEEASTAVGDFVGLPPIRETDIGPFAAAIGSIVILYFAARLLAKPLRRWLEQRTAQFLPAARFGSVEAGYLASGIAALIAFLAIAIVAGITAWPPYSELLFDGALALILGLAVFRIVRGAQPSGSIAMAAAIVAGGLTLSHRYDRLDRVRESLDEIAMAVGATQISALDLLNLLLGGIVLYAVARFVAHGARLFILSRSDLDVTQRLLAEKIAMIVIAVFAILAGIDMLGIDMTVLSIFGGTIGLGLGFGLQKIFSNLVSGIILLMDRSIKPGDTIMVSDTGIVGEVSKIGVRAASVITRDGKVHLIPNELLMTERVENWAYISSVIRMRLAVAVAYGTDLDLVVELMKEAALETERVQEEPAPVVWITDLNDRGIVHELRFWITAPDQGLGNVRGRIYRRILDKFAAHGIRMPNPGREITMLPTAHGDDPGPAAAPPA
ncbi:MAG: mechanosensitive ion channel domain-containing protein [Novosphingobium sp.]